MTKMCKWMVHRNVLKRHQTMSHIGESLRMGRHSCDGCSMYLLMLVSRHWVRLGHSSVSGGFRYCSLTTDVKTTPQKTRFHNVRNCKFCKEFTYRWKVNMWEQLTTSEVMTRNIATSTTTCCFCLQCPFLFVSVVLVCCTVPCIHDGSHCGSSLCLVRLVVIAIAMSHAHAGWLSPTSPVTFLLFDIFSFQHFLLPLHLP